MNAKQGQLRHSDYLEYMIEAINLDVVWDTVQQSLPELRQQLLRIQL